MRGLREGTAPSDALLRQDLDGCRDQPHQRRYRDDPVLYAPHHAGGRHSVLQADRHRRGDAVHRLEADPLFALSRSARRDRLAHLPHQDRALLPQDLAAVNGGDIGAYRHAPRHPCRQVLHE